jgi:hypothetical protein
LGDKTVAYIADQLGKGAAKLLAEGGWTKSG